ncbi:MAG: hypothetical protein CL477_09355 [Acidobacteria bacterium]|jgi:hypothetical protein|nr:hypothetical protein [Acidobacteriota bacterium]MDP7339307.1 hypothetical protein [Vicinamibacterales bacterium]MDP7480660.1 hypothetical protein [Vicinamibacterales bacterium]MDP7690276.1 hypothetical protein [Vicinamibacterales bacterium]HJN46821.1 hypothetical protein [Vicinamibacterales bacterium]|tara:strand:- start:1831 stop:2679 length:849 start_codon:yes stop_codon:yes gene_type:complete
MSKVLAAACLLSLSAPAAAQQIPYTQRPFAEMSLRPSGQPVIPVYDGWYANEDGTSSICFGYFNLNTEQTIDVQLGPANAIAPAEFDGDQPTHFDPVPDPELTNKYRHHWCVFTVRAPADFGAGRVVWTLNTQGEDLSVPGHLLPAYVLEERTSPGRGAVAPSVRLAANGPEGYGRNGLSGEPRTVSVGEPLELTAWVEHSEPGTWLGWTKHQGPGEVTFSAPEVVVSEPSGNGATVARFAAPGEYVVRVQAINDPGPRNPTGGFEFHCCWTNGYVTVTVTP